MKVFTIILNYNRPEDTLRCAESVLASKTNGFDSQIILVDNSEGSESADIFRARFPNLNLIQNHANWGYAEGNNIGIRTALAQGADYIWILNNDCEVDQTALRQLVEYAQNSPGTGILAPLVCRHDHPEQIDSCGTSLNWFRLRPNSPRYSTLGEGIPEILETQIIPGSALLLSRPFLEKVGLFDPDFFLIHEDADLCLRSLAAGFKNRVLTNARVYHKISGTFMSYPGWSLYYSVRNFLRLSRKHNPPVRRAIVLAGLVLLSLKRILAWCWTAPNREKLGWFLNGICDYFLNRRGSFTAATHKRKSC